jgi:hypothetical protein
MMTRPPWEVADVIRIAGSRFRERYGASLTWPQVKVLRAIAGCRTAALGGHLDVCTGCGYVTRYLLQLSKPALPKVSDGRSREVARQTPTGTVAGELFSPRLQRATLACPADVAEQEGAVHSLVRCRCCHLAKSRRRSQASRCRDRLPQHPAHLGTDLATASTYSLCCARRWSVSRSRTLALHTLPLLFTGEGSQPCFSRKVRGRIATCFSS